MYGLKNIIEFIEKAPAIRMGLLEYIRRSAEGAGRLPRDTECQAQGLHFRKVVPCIDFPHATQLMRKNVTLHV